MLNFGADGFGQTEPALRRKDKINSGEVLTIFLKYKVHYNLISQLL